MYGLDRNLRVRVTRNTSWGTNEQKKGFIGQEKTHYRVQAPAAAARMFNYDEIKYVSFLQFSIAASVNINAERTVICSGTDHRIGVGVGVLHTLDVGV